MIEELENLIKENNISQNNRQKIITGFKAIPFNQRRQIFDALKGHPELISIFIDLMNKKINLIKNPSQEKIDSIITEEEEILKKIFKNI